MPTIRIHDNNSLHGGASVLYQEIQEHLPNADQYTEKTTRQHPGAFFERVLCFLKLEKEEHKLSINNFIINVLRKDYQHTKQCWSSNKQQALTNYVIHTLETYRYLPKFCSKKVTQDTKLGQCDLAHLGLAFRDHIYKTKEKCNPVAIQEFINNGIANNTSINNKSYGRFLDSLIQWCERNDKRAYINGWGKGMKYFNFTRFTALQTRFQSALEQRSQKKDVRLTKEDMMEYAEKFLSQPELQQEIDECLTPLVEDHTTRGK